MTGVPGDPSDLAPTLLTHLRRHLAARALAYAAPPTPIAGGYDTRIWTFRLHDAPAPWSGPLVLRVLNPARDPRRALRERAIQNAVAQEGYPAPRVLWASADRTCLGAGFLVMERARGRPLLEDRLRGVGVTLAGAQARLHALDPEPVLRALDKEGRPAGGGVDRSVVGYGALLDAFDRGVADAALEGLAPGVRWLRAHRPAAGAPAICHGDFHPRNLLAEGGRVSAVLDWPNTVVTDPEYDVAATLVILRLVPIALLPVPAPLRPVVAAVRALMTARYLAAYRRARGLDRDRLAYYEAAACMRGLVRTGAARVAGDRNPLDASRFGARLAARFARVSGVAVSLPPWRR
ncbi:MAG TPA: phosphotransferase [Methylomirabilota bacterium]|nr:phosphotransferase [Methylomirabilota bacterium]